jgi:hypothetical protein
VGDGADSRGPLDRETRERRPSRKAQTKRETYSREDAIDARARWASRGGFGLRGSKASGLAGPEAEWPARSDGPKIRKKGFLN